MGRELTCWSISEVTASETVKPMKGVVFEVTVKDLALRRDRPIEPFWVSMADWERMKKIGDAAMAKAKKATN